MNDKVKNIDC